jgi:hypothetical protein
MPNFSNLPPKKGARAQRNRRSGRRDGRAARARPRGVGGGNLSTASSATAQRSSRLSPTVGSAASRNSSRRSSQGRDNQASPPLRKDPPFGVVLPNRYLHIPDSRGLRARTPGHQAIPPFSSQPRVAQPFPTGKNRPKPGRVWSLSTAKTADFRLQERFGSPLFPPAGLRMRPGEVPARPPAPACLVRSPPAHPILHRRLRRRCNAAASSRVRRSSMTRSAIDGASA